MTKNSSELIEAVSERLRQLRQAEGGARASLAPDFNVFEFIGNSELKLSKIISWLLDPQASHDQGATFLKAFLEWLGEPWSNLECTGVRVIVEAIVQGNRRVDILISAPHWAIAIENKPWAIDQQAQLQEYLSYLQNHRQRCLIYLTGTVDRLPGLHSISSKKRENYVNKGELFITNYKEMNDWIGKMREYFSV